MIDEPMIEEKVRNFGPITASHHLPQFSSAYLEINAGGITTEIKAIRSLLRQNLDQPLISHLHLSMYESIIVPR